MVLDREHRAVVEREPFERAVEQRDVGFAQPRGQDVADHDEAVVLARDLDPAGGEVLDRMVGAAMAEMHLLGARAERQRQDLVAEADAEDGQAARDQLPDHGHGVFAGRRRIARAVGEEHPVGFVAEDLLGARRSRHHRDRAALAREAAQDVALGPVIDRDHAVAGRGHPPEAGLRRPGRRVPAISPAAGHLAGEVHAGEPRPGPRLGFERGGVDRARLVVDQRRRLGAPIAQMPGEPARIDARDAHQIVGAQPVVEMPLGAVARRPGHLGAQHQPARGGGGRLEVLGVRADVADMGKGEGDDLPGVGGIGQDLLIARDRGVEAKLSHAPPASAQSTAPENRAVGKKKRRRGREVGRRHGVWHCRSSLSRGGRDRPRALAQGR